MAHQGSSGCSRAAITHRTVGLATHILIELSRQDEEELGFKNHETSSITSAFAVHVAFTLYY